MSDYQSKDFIQRHIMKMYNLVKNKKPLAIVFGVFLVLIIVVFCIVPSCCHQKANNTKPALVIKKSSHVLKHTNYIGKKLESISVKLAHIQADISKTKTVVNIDAVRKEVASLSQETNQLVAKSNVLIEKQIRESTANLSHQLQAIKRQLSLLQQSEHHPKLLNPNLLPFKVISIDNIQQRNVVTVTLDSISQPLEVGDALAGWTLIRANFTEQKSEFKNPKNQHVVVNMNERIKK